MVPRALGLECERVRVDTQGVRDLAESRRDPTLCEQFEILRRQNRLGMGTGKSFPHPHPHCNPHCEFDAHVDVQQSKRVAHNVSDPVL